ncbi:NADH-quinone oxidoreductase subunit K [Thermogladius sp. 4427co]|uniref:NADH-quinone oxidoreductase subunit K n=1 Tax=Thermogladius sp. 4427co TaxID=3450718 RepID=UPI003F78D605
MIESYIYVYIVLTITATIGVSLYGIVSRPHIVKKLVLLTILADAMNILVVLFGYYIGAVSPPVYPGGSLEGFQFPSLEELTRFSEISVDPIPQVLIVTAIVIGLAELLFLSLVTYSLGSKYKTLIIDKLEAGGE